MHDYIRQTVVLAKLQVKDTSGAKVALEAGLKSVPWLYGALFSALSLDTPKAIWGMLPRDTAEDLYTQLYLQAAKDL